MSRNNSRRRTEQIRKKRRELVLREHDHTNTEHLRNGSIAPIFIGAFSTLPASRVRKPIVTPTQHLRVLTRDLSHKLSSDKLGLGRIRFKVWARWIRTAERARRNFRRAHQGCYNWISHRCMFISDGLHFADYITSPKHWMSYEPIFLSERTFLESLQVNTSCWKVSRYQPKKNSIIS